MSEPFLDTLNAKQLAKEYKTLAKSIKNKDDGVKVAALEKLLEDCRYMTDGGCILPLLEIITPKKKTLDFSQTALQKLLQFLTLTPKATPTGEEAEDEADIPALGRISENPALDILKTVFSISTENGDQPNLGALQVLSDMIVYKDEVKKVKPPKVKKGETPPPMPKIYDSELSIALRNGSMNALHILISALDKNEGELAAALAQVPNLITNLCQKVSDITAVLVPLVAEEAPENANEEEGEAAAEIEVDEMDEVDEEEAAQDAVRKERAYATAMEECTWVLSSLAAMLRVNSTACQYLLSAPALEALPALVPISDALINPVLQILDALALRCDVGEGEISGLHRISEPLFFNVLLSIAQKASNSLKHNLLHEEDDEAPAVDLCREVENLNIAVSTLTHMAIQQRNTSRSLIVYTTDNVPDLLVSLNHLITDGTIWDVAKNSTHQKDFVDNICVLLGQIGLAGEDLRSSACSNGCVTALMKILTNSSSIALGHVPLLTLRRVCELALLQILSKGVRNESNSQLAQRWGSCQAYSTDEAFFSEVQTSSNAPVEDEEEAPAEPVLQSTAFMNQLAALLEDNDEDSDLSNRAVRLFAAVVASTVNPLAFVRDTLAISTTVTSSLSALCCSRGAAVVQKCLPPAPELAPQAEADTEEEVIVEVVVPQPSTHLSIPPEECLYLSMSLIEVLVAVQSEHVDEFVVDSYLNQISDVLFASGPSVVSKDRQEFSVKLYDPRRAVDAVDSDCTAALLRPLVLDALATVIHIDTAEPKGAKSLSICALCADACVSTLSAEVSYGVHTAERNVFVSPAKGTLHVSVLNAAIQCMNAIACCGAEGINNALSSLVNYKKEGAVQCGAVEHFKAFLGGASTDEVTEQPLPEPVVTGEVEGEEGDEAPAEPTPVLSAREKWEQACEEEWIVPSNLADILNTNSLDSVLSTVTNLCSKANVWPMVTMVSPLIAVLAGPQCKGETATHAVTAVASLLREVESAQIEGQQAGLFNALDACFTGLGGIIALASATSPYGTLQESATNETAHDLLQFLVNRGASIAEAELSLPAENENEDEEEAAAPPAHIDAYGIWKALLDIWCDDSHQKDANSTALLTAIRGGLSTLACTLINRGADVNRTDNHTEITPLMFALVLGHSKVVDELISHNADVNAMDTEGNTVVKYSFATINQSNVDAIITAATANGTEILQFYGCSALTGNIVDAGADIKVSNSSTGNCAIHHCVGLGVTSVRIGGQHCRITSGAYIDESVISNEQICNTMKQLCSTNADVNAANADGISALHIAAARGHIELMQLLVNLGANPNCLDGNKYLPVHHAAARCPNRAVEVIDAAISLGQFCATRSTTYDKERDELSKEDRTVYDIDKALDDVFLQAINPTCIYEKRNSSTSLALATTNDGLNLLHLLMAGGALKAGSTADLNTLPTVGGKDDRMSAVITLLTRWLEGSERDMATSLITGVSSSGLNTIHAVSLLLQGRTPQVELTEAQKRSKRIKSYESPELHIKAILASILDQSSYSALSTHTTPSLAALGITEWSPLHGAVVSDNCDFARELSSQVDMNATISSLLSIITAANATLSEETYAMVIDATAGMSANNIQNLQPNPVCSACANGNVTATRLLASCPRFDINGLNETGNTPVVMTIQACMASNNWDLLDALAIAADRWDLSKGIANAIDLAVDQRSTEVLGKLFAYRKNDVLERIITSKTEDAITKLLELEQENMSLAETLGIAPPTLPKEIIVVEDSAVSVAPEDDGIAESKTSDEESSEKVAASTTASIIPSLTEEERNDILARLDKNDALLRLMFENGVTEVVGSDCHAHSCFNDAKLYRDFCADAIANAAKAAAEAEAQAALAASEVEEVE